MKSKKIIRLVFSVTAYVILMSFFGCEEDTNVKNLVDLQNNIVSTLSFTIP